MIKSLVGAAVLASSALAGTGLAAEPNLAESYSVLPEPTAQVLTVDPLRAERAEACLRGVSYLEYCMSSGENLGDVAARAGLEVAQVKRDNTDYRVKDGVLIRACNIEKTIRSGPHRAKYVLGMFSASYCFPCHEVERYIREHLEELESRGWAFFNIPMQTDEDKERIRRQAKHEWGIDFMSTTLPGIYVFNNGKFIGQGGSNGELTFFYPETAQDSNAVYLYPPDLYDALRNYSCPANDKARMITLGRFEDAFEKALAISAVWREQGYDYGDAFDGYRLRRILAADAELGDLMLKDVLPALESSRMGKAAVSLPDLLRCPSEAVKASMTTAAQDGKRLLFDEQCRQNGLGEYK